MAHSGEAFNLFYCRNDGAFSRLVGCYRVDAWLTNGKVVQ